jgi:GNAT superfamily N-acetyltransferase
LSLSAELRAFAETPDRYTDIGPDLERYTDERVCVLQGPTWAAVSDVHVGASEVESLLAEIRQRVPVHKSPIWWLGPSTEPSDTHEQLVALGLGEPSDRAPVLQSVALVDAPPESPPGIEVRRVETFDDFLVAYDVMWEGFATPEDRREADRPHLRTMYDGMRASGVPATFVAWLDGEPVGVGRSVYSPFGSFLIAGAVIPAARGRGVYRALVRARWEDAVARGAPALVSETVPETSYPILKGLGFVDVCVMRRLQDSRA